MVSFAFPSAPVVHEGLISLLSVAVVLKASLIYHPHHHQTSLPIETSTITKFDS
jgi:hypothetical protein